MSRYDCLPWADAGDAKAGQSYAREQVGKPYWPIDLGCGCKLWPMGVEPNPECDVDVKFPWHGWKEDAR